MSGHSKTATAGDIVQEQAKRDGKKGRAGRFVDACNRGRASIKQKGQAALGSVEEVLDQGVDWVLVNLSQTDYERRRQRFDQLVLANENDKMLADAISQAKEHQTKIDAQRAKMDGTGPKKPTWTQCAYLCTVATAALIDGINAARSQEKEAAKANPQLSKVLAQIATNLGKVPPLLTTTQHADYTTSLGGLRFELANMGKTKEKNSTSTAIDRATKLLQDVAGSQQSNKAKQDQLLQQLKASQTRLAGAPAALAEQRKTDPRLAVNNLITQADTAIYVLDFTTAATAIAAAEKALDEMKAPPADQAVSPDDLLGKIEAVLKAEKEWTARTSALPPTMAAAVTQRLTATFEQIMATKIAVKKGGALVAADGSRQFQTYQNELADIDAAIKGYDEFKKNRAAADKAVMTLQTEVRAKAEAYYVKIGADTKAGGEAGFQSRASDIVQRWKKALDVSLSMKELNQDAYINELNALASEIASSAGNKDQVAVEMAVSRYRAALATLNAEAKRVIDADSDLAIRMGLTTQPDKLRKAGELAVSPRGGAPAPAEHVKLIDAVTEQINTLAATAKSFDATTLNFELDMLFQRCQDDADKIRRMANGVIAAIALDESNVISTGKPAERAGLTTYGKNLIADLETILAPVGGLAKKDGLDAGLLGDAQSALVGLKRRVEAYQTMFPPQKGSSIPNFASLKERADKLLKKLNDHALFKPRLTLTEPWRTSLADISENVFKRDPKQTDDTLKALEIQVAAAKVTARAEHKASDLAATELATVAANIINNSKDYQKLAEAPSYREDLIRRLQQKSKDVKTADKTDKDADALLNEVAAAIRGDGAGKRAEGEVEAKKKQAAYDAAKKELVRLREVELELLDETASKLGREAKGQLLKHIKELRDAVSGALKSLEATRNTQAALDMARAIDQRVRLLAAAPLGSSTRGRNNLGAVDERWKKAVQTLHVNLAAIPALVKPACAGDSEAEAAADAIAATLVGPVKDLFRPDAFSAMIKRIQSADETGLLETREVALREVRRLTKMMESDFRVRLLSKVPFDGAVSIFPEIGNSLWDLETNLVTCG